MQLIKQYGVWLALGLTLIASFWVTKQEDAAPDTVVLVHKKNNAYKATSSNRRSTAGTLLASSSNVYPRVYQRPMIKDIPQNLFTVFVSPQELTPDEETNTGLQMPANPFTYEGKLLDDGKLIVFLTDGVRNHSVQVGDVLDDVWQIQSIHPPELTLKYIPLKTEIQMQIGASS